MFFHLKIKCTNAFFADKNNISFCFCLICKLIIITSVSNIESLNQIKFKNERILKRRLLDGGNILMLRRSS